jgi:hypothetical protein
MDAWDQRRSAYKKPYLLRALLSLSVVIGGLVWMLFLSVPLGSLFVSRQLFGELILGLVFTTAIEIATCSLFFHFYFARSAQASS